MHPTAELNALGWRKAELRQRIAVTRLHCTTLAVEAAKPIVLFDRVRAQWQRISPIAKLVAVPLLLLLRRGVSRRAAGRGLLVRLWRWLPAMLSATRLLRRGVGMV